MKFSAVLIFAVLWFTFAYTPIAHMVWFWMGPDAYTDPKLVEGLNAKAGLLWQWGALDFAGGTVVHINAGVAGLGGRLPHRQAHRLRQGGADASQRAHDHDRRGAAVGGLVWLQRGVCTRGRRTPDTRIHQHVPRHSLRSGGLDAGEWDVQGQAVHARRCDRCRSPGLVRSRRQRATSAFPGAFVIGLASGFVLPVGVNGLSGCWARTTRSTSSGVHAVGGILGALLTGVFNAQSLGGPGLVTDWVTGKVASNPVMDQVWIQAQAVA